MGSLLRGIHHGPLLKKLLKQFSSLICAELPRIYPGEKGFQVVYREGDGVIFFFSESEGVKQARHVWVLRYGKSLTFWREGTGAFGNEEGL